MHRRHNLCNQWYQKNRHRFLVHIQCIQWTLLWWRRIRVRKRFDWRLHLCNNDLLHMFEMCHSNCTNQEEHHCMPWNLWLCCQIHWGICDTWCCRANLERTRQHRFDISTISCCLFPLNIYPGNICCIHQYWIRL